MKYLLHTKIAHAIRILNFETELLHNYNHNNYSFMPILYRRSCICIVEFRLKIHLVYNDDFGFNITLDFIVAEKFTAPGK